MSGIRRCEGYFGFKGRKIKCRRAAIMTRETTRLGCKNEPTIVCYQTHLCVRCARIFDSAMAAIDAETRAA